MSGETDELTEALDDDNLEIAEQLVEQIEALQDDDDFDMESQSRQDEGWLRFYVECPECQTPMVRASGYGGGSKNSADGVRIHTAELRAVCPNCKEYASIIDIERRTGNVNDILWEGVSQSVEDE